ncbi:MAG: hypothetical protein R3A79_24580 [Nannocystaceae bacterium]
MPDERAINQLLERFASDPAAALDALPPKLDAAGQAVHRAAFSRDDVASGRHIDGRDELRRGHAAVEDGVIIRLEDILPGRAPFELSDRAESLVDRLTYTDLATMDEANLRAAELRESPWSDDYWAICRGILGARYADRDFPADGGWQRCRSYVQGRPAAAIVAGGAASELDRLAPAEKYDLLVGDAAGTLTRAMWAQGEAYFARYGKVETWMGICHGWAPAAYMLGRPRKVVTALAADGRTQLRFYPSDIKGLASLLWANASTVSRFVGGRCNDKNPGRDRVGRVVSTKCFDTNPGTWHMAVVNQIGHMRRSLIIDATFDYEVWNQPVFAYAYSYFNPQTLRFSPTLHGATVPYAAFTRDWFRSYRSPKVRAVAGIAMDLRYVVETKPTHSAEDSPADDAIHTVRYLYDVELDAAGEIIGGEWYTNRHPDFLWTPPPGARAKTAADAFAREIWSKGQPLPPSWRQAALRAAGSTSGPAPLAKIVEGLIERANA